MKLTEQLFSDTGGGGDLGMAPPYDRNAAQPTDTLKYVLSAQIQGTPPVIQGIVYTSTPTGYMNGEKKPLMMQVPKPKAGRSYAITLALDGTANWRFPTSRPALRLVKKSNTDSALPPPEQRYLNCIVAPDQMSMTFNAPHVDLLDNGGKPLVNYDTVNFVIELAQLDENGKPTFDNPLILIVDPDIKNPGDDLRDGGG
jgi:hypothetical protein